MNNLWCILAEKTDHDILIELSTKMDLLYNLFTNHLAHHFAYNMALLGALLSLVAGVLLYVLKTRKWKAVLAEASTENEGK